MLYNDHIIRWKPRIGIRAATQIGIYRSRSQKCPTLEKTIFKNSICKHYKMRSSTMVNHKNSFHRLRLSADAYRWRVLYFLTWFSKFCQGVKIVLFYHLRWELTLFIKSGVQKSGPYFLVPLFSNLKNESEPFICKRKSSIRCNIIRAAVITMLLFFSIFSRVFNCLSLISQ